jgi:uncharacterized protein with von Willebrand factor type A (vWA) domain
MSALAREDWAERIARLGGALRAKGIGASVRDEIDATEAIALVDDLDKDDVRTALAIALKIRRADRDAFERAFDAFWGKHPSAKAVAPPQTRPPAPADRPRRRRQPTVLRWDPDQRRMDDAPDGRPSPTGGEQPGHSPDALLRRRSFDDVTLSARELAAMERMILRLARRFAARRSRRLVPTLSRGTPDLRRSLRRALRTSGEMLTFARRTHAVDRPRLAFLCDTSGSMDGHTRFLLMFVLCVRRAIPGAEVFAFNTELTRLTPALGSLVGDDARRTLERLSSGVADWSGGTQIGGCLATFVREHLDRHVDGRSVVVIVSDGLDRGDPSLLAPAVQAIQARAKKLVWLNPLKGDPAYEPLTRGMRAAMPYIDYFASAHNLESLEDALSHLAA